jgi:FKBP12-rapamycin complex-associated protein
VYSLTVASKSPSVLRKNAALAIMEKMRIHSPLLVEQALLVSQELIRVAILWHEMWHEGLEEASRLYFGDRNINGMLAQLEPLHMMLQRVRVWIANYIVLKKKVVDDNAWNKCLQILCITLC